jgi:hypothetical protein
LVDCEGFDQRVPSAPSRYREARLLSEKVCSAVESMPGLARRLVRGEGTASADFELANDRSGVLMSEAEESLRQRMSFNRMLPVERSVRSRIDPEFSRVASAIAGRAVEARCWAEADWRPVVRELNAFYGERIDRGFSGFAEPAVSRTATIHLAPFVCQALSSPRDYDDRDLSFPVDVLAHEAEHILGPTSSEAVTECFGMQAIPQTAGLLGLPAERGRELANRYWHYWYLRNPTDYRVTDCSEGGPLDNTPGDGIWP